MFHLPEGVHQPHGSQEPPAHSHGAEALSMSGVWEGVPCVHSTHMSPTNPHQREALRLPAVRQELFQQVQPAASSEDAPEHPDL